MSDPDRSGDDLLRRTLEFLDVGDEDGVRLRRMRDAMDAHREPFLDEFYGRLLSHEETARFLRNPELLARLRELQWEHFRSLLSAEWTGEFLERRRLVGRAHATRGIEPLPYLGAYRAFVEYTARHATEPGADVLEDVLCTFKAVLLDCTLTLDSYFAKLTEELRSALDLLWRANESLRQFARLASHDLKTPLGTVANLCEETLDEFGDDLPDGARDLIEAARRTVFKMGESIDELLSTTLTEDDAASVESVSLGDVVREACHLLRSTLEASDTHVDVVAPLPTIVGNRAALREVFANLITNSAKYVPDRPARVTVEARTEGDAQLVTVTDNGPAIPLEFRSSVFEPFFRLPAHTDLSGNGLGLYFVRTLVERQGGRITATAGPRNCCRFEIRLADARRHDPL